MDPAPQAPARRHEGSSVIVRTSTEDPLTDLLTRTAIAALTCGCDLVSETGFSHSYAADAETPEQVEASRRVTWVWDAKKLARFRPGFAIAEDGSVVLPDFGA